MSTTYRTSPGDTFSTISRRVYGIETEGPRIRKANPGVFEPIPGGIILFIPPRVSRLDGYLFAQGAEPDEVRVFIDGKRFRFWESIRVSRSLDTISTFELSAPFNPDLLSFRETFRPFSYKPVLITLGEEVLLTGTLMEVLPQYTAASNVVVVSGYGRPGVLADCTLPVSAYPKDYWETNLLTIAAELASPFGIPVEFSAGDAFGNLSVISDEGISLGYGRKILAFLAEQAKQKNLVISDTPEGALLFQQSIAPGRPVAELRMGAGLRAITPQFNPQEFYSSVTGVEPVWEGLEGSDFTVRNDLLEGVMRPFVFAGNDTVDTDIELATRARVGRMFGNAVSYQADLATIFTPDGVLWRPNTTAVVEAPGAMIYHPYEFLVRSVDYKITRNAREASLKLTVPGAFSGDIPGVLPWEG